MRYGIDADGVIANFLDAFRKHLNNRFGSCLKREDITSYYWHENTDKFNKDDFFTEFHKFGRAAGYRNLELIPGVVDALERIANNGHEIFYITNRPEYTRQDTIDYFKEHNLPFKKNLFYAHGDKSPIINKLNIDIFVEDSSEVISNLLSNTKVKIYCMDYAHNRDVEHERVTRIKDWDDFLLAEAI